MADAWSAVGGAFIGAFAGIGAGIVLEAFKRYRDRVGTASALVGEISAILDIANTREYVQYSDWLLEKLRQAPGHKVAMLFGDPKLVDPILEKHLDKLGLLGGDLPERVAIFYSRVRAIRFDWARLSSHEFDDKLERRVDLVKFNGTLWKKTAVDGKVLCADLKKLAARRHWLSTGYWFR